MNFPESRHHFVHSKRCTRLSMT